MCDDLPSVVRAKEQIARVLAILRTSNDGWANSLEEILESMDGWYATKEALFGIGVMCHPKAMRDWGTPSHVSSWDWLRELDALEQACADAFNELERRGPDPG